MKQIFRYSTITTKLRNDWFKQDARIETNIKFGINSSKSRYLESVQTSDLISSSTEKFDGKVLLGNFYLWKNSKSTSLRIIILGGIVSSTKVRNDIFVQF